MQNNKKPSVMFVAPSAYVLSGLATWLDYMEPGLGSLGWDVTIGLVEGPRHHRPEKYIAGHVHCSWYPISCKSGTQEGRLRAVEKAISVVNPDIVATVNMPDAILGAARSRQYGRPELKVAMTVHGIQPDLYEDIGAYGDLLDRVFCTNRLACKLAEVMGNMDAGRISHVPYGVEFDGPAPRSEPGECLKIAYVGRLEQDQKQIFDLPPIIEALETIGVPYELMIAGNGPDEKQLRAEFGSRVDDGRITFLGFISPEELQRQVLAEVDVLLLTSSWETGPIVIWEAMASGVAVVSSNYIGSGLESALHDDDNALMFPVGDTGQAAAQLQRLWCEAGLIARLRQAAYRLIEERYTIAVSVANWDQNLKALLEQPSLEHAPHIGGQQAAGRLDRLLGGSAAESVRTLLGSTGPDGGAGGEWPHSHGTTDYWDASFWAKTEQLDRRSAEGAAK
ncbi:glycosyltransferase family 4 protein [Mariprofundus ferrooxydans]|uniref:glycosyltransferase family 4 protein n=1 Tax=Mariprofundus ferrooxydans TaxID=314344 RepID=UPI00142F8C35|nr:glycosyltransferase family 4 protein [Mariprofundus ferrooxydans]